MNDNVIDSLFRHLDSEEQAALGEFVEEILVEMEKSLEFWRDADDCFPDGAFTLSKYDHIHAGIVADLISFDKDGLRIPIKGHADICPPYDERNQDVAQELIFGIDYPGYWSGSDWTMYFEEDILIDDWHLREAKVIARFIMIASRDIIARFREEIDYVLEQIAIMDAPGEANEFLRTNGYGL